MMLRIIGRLICVFKGHLRGKRVASHENGSVKVYACPRCGRKTSYPVKAAT